MGKLWQKLDCLAETKPRHLDKTDNCYYAREYISGGVYSGSQANDLVLNFKKPPDRKGKTEWKWKLSAVKQFALELSSLLRDGTCVAAIPTSKPDDDPEFDNRFDLMLADLQQTKSTLRIEKPIIRVARAQSLHEGGTRSVVEVQRTLNWVGFRDPPPSTVYLVDDVLTWGTNFKACQEMIQQRHPRVVVAGIFWAKTVWQS